MNLDRHLGLKMEKAACAFLHWALTSVNLLPTPGSLLDSWCCQRFLGTRSPWFWLHVPLARPWQLALAVPRASDAGERSSGSGKSTSSNFHSLRVSWIPVHCQQWLDGLPMQSSATRKKKGLTMHPLRTPVLMLKFQALSYHHPSFSWKLSYKRPRSGIMIYQGFGSTSKSSRAPPNPQNQRPFHFEVYKNQI